MSVITQIIYKALNTLHEECSKQERCTDCALNDVCMRDTPAERWTEEEMDKMTSAIYDIGWKG